MSEDLRQKFLKVYYNLPISSREETILDLEDHGPITWNVAYIEVKENTKISEIILSKLNDLNFI